ncbi:MAG: hypothetical protein L3J07_02185 [Candidatus Magasanikbacteria bacterium]|nr:hypothetical protein [Candidatus Magasanikbacteria bacterium]
MSRVNWPNEGDVIKSPKFAYGKYDMDDVHDKKCARIDGKTETCLVSSRISEKDRIAIAVKTGKMPPKEETIDYTAYDTSRATAKFVVEKAEMSGGSTGFRLNEYHPDEWCVHARRLNEDNSYNEDGELIRFYVSNSSSSNIREVEIESVGKMKRQFVWK